MQTTTAKRPVALMPHIFGEDFTPETPVQIESARRRQIVAEKLAGEGRDAAPTSEEIEETLTGLLRGWDYNRVYGGRPSLTVQILGGHLIAETPNEVIAELSQLTEEPYAVLFQFEDKDGNVLRSSRFTQDDAEGFGLNGPWVRDGGL